MAKWIVKIEWLDDHVQDDEEYLVVTEDEDVFDEDVFYYVENELEILVYEFL